MKSGHYKLSEHAVEDLRDIWSYVASEASMDMADEVLDRIQSTLQEAADSPGIGHQRDDIGGNHLRFLNVYSYVIAYEADSDPLTIYRIIHGARDLESLL